VQVTVDKSIGGIGQCLPFWGTQLLYRCSSKDIATSST